jgi:hypothetical protein
MNRKQDEMRKHLSSLSFTEKIKILEKLRDRSLTLAASGLRRPISSQRTEVARKMSANVKKKG